MASIEIHEGNQHQDEIKKQIYEQIKQSCLKQKCLFEDKLFPPRDLSSFLKKGRIMWDRPRNLFKNPQFFIGKTDRFDVVQGKLNDCWFISALSVLAMNPSLLEKVVPHQSFEDYAGVFYFNFYECGEWISVVVDDLLPTCDGALILAHSETRNEFWSALLEKAYAKLKGDYDLLNYGFAIEAFVDLTGGIPESFKFESPKQVPENFFNILHRSILRSSLICVNIDLAGSAKATFLTNGLVSMHSYSLTGIKQIIYRGRNVNLIRLKNPWDNCADWKGAWSENSPEWKSINEKHRREVGLSAKGDGEFWMSYDDFIKNFNVFEFCHINAYSSSNKYNWYSVEFFGQWVKNVNAGGCVNNKDTFYSNPKYLLTLVDTDVEDDDDLCTIIISLMQKYYRYRKLVNNIEVKIGFVIYYYGDISDEDRRNKKTFAQELKPEEIDKEFFRVNSSIARVNYLSKREVSCRFRFKSGRYIIIPTTFEKNREAKYMLRIFVSKSEENKESFKLSNRIMEVESSLEQDQNPVEAKISPIADSTCPQGCSYGKCRPDDNSVVVKQSFDGLFVKTPTEHSSYFQYAHKLSPTKIDMQQELDRQNNWS